MRSCVSFKVKLILGGWRSYAGCGRNLGRTQFFTHRLAVLRLPPSDPSAQKKSLFCVYSLYGSGLIGEPVESVVVCDKLCFRVYVI